MFCWLRFSLSFHFLQFFFFSSDALVAVKNLLLEYKQREYSNKVKMKGKLQLMLQRHIETTKNNNMPKITLGNQEEMGKF